MKQVDKKKKLYYHVFRHIMLMCLSTYGVLMKKDIRKYQNLILEEFSRENCNFALAGGTALELFYLNHRFSADLDFFSVKYDRGDIEKLVNNFERKTKLKIEFDNQFKTENRARVMFYFAEIKPGVFLKLDFIEDVFFSEPLIKKINNIPVYDIEHIYYQKIMAVAGTFSLNNEIGRQIPTGRNAEKDVYDLYCLSLNISPLHKFLKKMPGQQQRGMVTWYRSYSRQDLKINILDLDIYDNKFDSSRIIKHLDDEIKEFIRGQIQ